MIDTENLPALLREDARHHLDVAQQCDCDPMDTVNYRHMQNALHAADEIEHLRARVAELESWGDVRKTVKANMVAYTIECPSCGHALAILGNAYQCINRGCGNRTKYKIPMVELEVIDPPTPEKSDEPQSNI